MTNIEVGALYHSTEGNGNWTVEVVKFNEETNRVSFKYFGSDTVRILVTKKFNERFERFVTPAGE